jgi:uncharacterized protein YxeA
MKNKKIILSVIIVVFILVVGFVFALYPNLIKKFTPIQSVDNSSEYNNLSEINNTWDTNNSSKNSVNNNGKSSNPEGDGVSKEQAKQRAAKEIEGKNYIVVGDPDWNSKENMWNVPLFDKNNNNQPFGSVYIYVSNGKITNVVPYF